MMNIQFKKMHGLGNDFVIIDNTTQNIDINPKLVELLCNRKFGIGCDQLLLIKQNSGSQFAFNYRVFNKNGSEAEQCGNGARCVVKFIADNYNYNSTPITLLTLNREITGVVNKSELVTVSMGIPIFIPDKIPFVHHLNTNNIYELQFNNLKITCGVVSMGNPHAVIKLFNDLELEDTKSLEEIAKSIQNSKYFPNGVNVNFYYKIDNNNIKLVTYERGAGFTLACGTGACATSSYCIQQKEVNNIVNVLTLGGSLTVEWDSINELKMTGEARDVFQGQITI